MSVLVSSAVGNPVQNIVLAVDGPAWTRSVHLDGYVRGVNYRWPSTAARPMNASLHGVIPTVHSCEDD